MAESRTTSSSEQQSSCSTGSGKTKQRQSFHHVNAREANAGRRSLKYYPENTEGLKVKL